MDALLHGFRTTDEDEILSVAETGADFAGQQFLSYSASETLPCLRRLGEGVEEGASILAALDKLIHLLPTEDILFEAIAVNDHALCWIRLVLEDRTQDLKDGGHA